MLVRQVDIHIIPKGLATKDELSHRKIRKYAGELGLEIVNEKAPDSNGWYIVEFEGVLIPWFGFEEVFQVAKHVADDMGATVWYVYKPVYRGIEGCLLVR